MRWLALILAFVESAAMAAPPSIGSRNVVAGASTTAEPWIDHCQTGMDHAGRYIYHPESECCTTTASDCASGTSGTTYKRWTRECVAKAAGQPIVIIGSETATSLSLSGTFKYDTNSCFGNDLSGSQNITSDNQKTYTFDIESKALAANKPNPLFFLAIRNDTADAYDLGTSDSDIGSFDREWLLKTSRAWTGANSVNAYIEGLGAGAGFSGCRYPQSVTTDPSTNGDLWSSITGCAQSAAGYEYLKTPYIMSGTTVGARQNAVYYVFFRDGVTQRTFYPVAMMADLTNPRYRAWLIRYIWLRMEREHMDGFEMAHKLHRYWDAATGVRLEPWMVTGDGLGATYHGATKRLCYNGGGGSDDTNVTTLAQIATPGGTNRCDYLLTGPPKIRASDSDYAVDTEFTYPLYVSGLKELGHLAYTNTPRLPYVIHVNPYWYDGCTAGTVFTAANGYTDASCSTKFDDPATVGVNEAALIRQWVQEGGYAVIDRDDGVNAGSSTNNGLGERVPTNCSPLPCDGGMGSGGGSGLSSVQLKAMLKGGDPPAIRVEVYDSTQPRSYPSKLTTYPWQTNPEPALTVPTFDPECANGVDDDADGLTDYPDDTGCDGATGTDETSPTVAECGDGLDNDSDGLTDYPTDTGCQSALDPRERGQCQDGFDNDGDGTTDYPADVGCTSATDDNEL